jgi:FMN reductase
MDGPRSLVVVSAGLSQPSSTRLLADRLAAATEQQLDHDGVSVERRTIELRDHAQDLVSQLLTNVPSAPLQDAVDAVLAADGLVVVSPIFNASYSGLFKVFFDVIERDGLNRKPVLLAATGGTARHSLALEYAFRPLFAYLAAAVVPTTVFAAPEDWAQGGDDPEPSLVERIDRASREFAAAVAARPAGARTDPFEEPVPFERLLGGTSGPDRDRGRR